MSKLTDVLKSIAPTLAGAIGTAAGGPLAGVALATLSKSLLGKDNGTREELEAATASLSAVDRVRLTELDQTFKLEMEKQGVRVIELDQADKESARDLQKAALLSGDKFAQHFVYYFAGGWSIVAAMFIFGVTFFEVPAESVRFADTTLGFLLGQIVATIVSFFFGSSYSSRQKDSAIHEAIKR